MNKLDFQDKKVAILGVGIEGIALGKFLEGKTSELVFLDRADKAEILGRLEEKEDAVYLLDKYDLISGEGYLDNLFDYDVIFRSPGVPLLIKNLQEAERHGAVISSQIKLFFELCPCKIVGVTGTKGKGTTASLIYEIIKRNNQETRDNCTTNVYLAGNIGYPAITLIPELKSDDIVILELSSFQLMDLERSPHIAVVTNLTVDHLDYHRDIDEYQNAKTSIIKFQHENDYAVLNKESTFNSQVVSELKSKIRYFSDKEEKDAVVKNDKVILDPKNRNIEICQKDGIKLFGRHNLENIAAASVVADILEIDDEVIKSTVSEFVGLPHRLELVAESDGVKYINDSFATNPDPTMAAIDSFSENKILILGGSSKGANFDSLAKHISESNVSAVILIGAEGEKIGSGLAREEFRGEVRQGGNSMEEIVQAAKSLAKQGDTIIFSPACASFDMFINYKDRGERFKTSVLNLISKS